MKKLLARVGTAERVAAKRKAKWNRLLALGDKHDKREQRRIQRDEQIEDYKRAKKAIRDDWHLGPAAPTPHVGVLGQAYGAMSSARFSNTIEMNKSQREARFAWLGGPKNVNLVEGDRVVLLAGPDEGKIGKISDVMVDNGEVTVEGLNRSNVLLPDIMRTPGGPLGASVDVPISISGVRLVHPLRDPATGVTSDVIINELRHVRLYADKVTGETTWDRLVPGLNVVIPWPTKKDQEKETFAIDTPRLYVEARSFTPTLLRPPMPANVIDELRNPYSRFRTRHTPEYIARKEAEDPAAKHRENLRLMDGMRTPLMEFHRAERDRKKKAGKPRLTLEMLEAIGRVIAKNRRGGGGGGGGGGLPPGLPPAGNGVPALVSNAIQFGTGDTTTVTVKGPAEAGEAVVTKVEKPKGKEEKSGRGKKTKGKKNAELAGSKAPPPPPPPPPPPGEGKSAAAQPSASGPQST